MSDVPTVKRQWERIVPASGYTYTEATLDPGTGEQTFKVTCYAAGDPPPPPLPEASGTWQDWIGRHHVKVEWQYKDNQFQIVDFDLTVSLDEEPG